MGFRVTWARGLRQVRAMISLPRPPSPLIPLPSDGRGEQDAGARDNVGARGWTLGLPAAAIGRIAALFLFLVSLKLILLWELRRHLQETHWRIEPHGVGWSG